MLGEQHNKHIVFIMLVSQVCFNSVSREPSKTELGVKLLLSILLYHHAFFSVCIQIYAEKELTYSVLL